MEDDDIVAIGTPLPLLRSAAPLDHRRARVEWQDGLAEEIDLSPVLMSHRHFIRLRSDDALFRTMQVNEEGTAIRWNDGSELSAFWIEQLEPAFLDNDQFREAMDKLNLSLDGMAARLGIARRRVADYRKNKPIPPAIALATKYLVELRKRAD